MSQSQHVRPPLTVCPRRFGGRCRHGLQQESGTIAERKAAGGKWQPCRTGTWRKRHGRRGSLGVWGRGGVVMLAHGQRGRAVLDGRPWGAIPKAGCWQAGEGSSSSSSDVSLRTHQGRDHAEDHPPHRFNRPQTYLFVLTRGVCRFAGFNPPRFQSSSDVSLRTHPGMRFAYIPEAAEFQSSSDVSLRTHCISRVRGIRFTVCFNRPQTYLFVLTECGESENL